MSDADYLRSRIANQIIANVGELGIMFKTLPQPVGSEARKLQALMA